MFKTLRLKNHIAGILLIILACSGLAMAQMPNDAIYMSKSTACLALSYSRSSWDKYWESSLLRQNLNVGTHTTQSAMAMLAVGITKDVNIIVGLPYVWTQASVGNLRWQRGAQDFSGWVKYRFLNKSGLSLHAIVGGSLPASNYIPDFLPMSIGMQAKTATGRFMASYRHQSGVYITGSAAYTLRSKIIIDRDAYQADDRIYNTNEVSVPNAYDYSARIGYLKKAIQAEGFLEHGACDGGDGIRRNDMPFPTNNMKATMAGAYVKFQPRNFGVNARASYVINGANVGQSTAFSVGILYQFQYLKTTEKQKTSGI